MRIGVEVGGTFTDLIAVDESGQLNATGKVFSTPSDPSSGVLSALRERTPAQREGAPLLHGSTVATNAVIERKGASVGLLVTHGFRDILELQRQDRERIYDLHYQKPEPLVPRDLVMEICERVGASGEVVSGLDEDSVRSAVRTLVEKGVNAVAVCLLHAYKNPAHEQRVREIIAEACPDLHVSLSSEVVAEFREYERASTTVIDAFVKPVVDRYVDHLENETASLGLSGISIMQSNGGTLPASYARNIPVRTLFSGPAAGVTGAVSVAGAAGLRNIITMDMGGTSTDVCLVTGGHPEITSDAFINRLPLKMPMIDIVSVGAGGGSIAWLDSGGMLQVGPASAGADPGPACYGLGGTDPTITDANVVRGLIRPHHFLGGQHVLDRAAAREVMERLATESGIEANRLAEDIYRISCATMAGAIRVVSVERGYDPREYTLVAYGGAGPLHAATVADELNITRVLVPPLPGLMSAYGLLVGDFQRDFARTSVDRLRNLRLSDIRNQFESLEQEALAELDAQGIDADAATRAFGIDMRYRGQGFELTLPVTGADLNAADTTSIEHRFHELHRTRYGHATPGEDIEAVTYRLSVTVQQPKPAPLRMPENDTVPAETVPIVVGGSPTECAFHWRSSLRPGACLSGPAVVEEPTGTTFIPSGWTASVDDATNLVLERS